MPPGFNPFDMFQSMFNGGGGGGGMGGFPGMNSFRYESTTKNNYKKVLIKK